MSNTSEWDDVIISFVDVALLPIYYIIFYTDDDHHPESLAT